MTPNFLLLNSVCFCYCYDFLVCGPCSWWTWCSWSLFTCGWFGSCCFKTLIFSALRLFVLMKLNDIRPSFHLKKKKRIPCKCKDENWIFIVENYHIYTTNFSIILQYFSDNQLLEYYPFLRLVCFAVSTQLQIHSKMQWLAHQRLMFYSRNI